MRWDVAHHNLVLFHSVGSNKPVGHLQLFFQAACFDISGPKRTTLCFCFLLGFFVFYYPNMLLVEVALHPS